MNEPQPGMELAQRALELLRTARYAEAERAADLFLAIAPGDANGLYFKGAARLFGGDSLGGLHFLDRALATIGPEPSRGRFLAQLNRCRAFLALDRFQEAREAIEEAVSIEPGSDDARLKLGEALLCQGDAEAALIELQKVSPDARNGPRALARLGEAFELLDRHDEAIEAVEEALRRAPDDVVVNLVWGHIALDRGETARVAERLAGRADRDDWPPDERMSSWSLVGQALAKEGDFAAAFDAFTRANDVQIKRLERAPAAFQLRDVIGGGRATREMIASAPNGLWPEPRPEDPSPVFLIGFPRSGTTLLDQILNSHSQCAVVEERQEMHIPLWLRLDGGPERLAERAPELGAEGAQAMRDEYMKQLAIEAPKPPPAVVIDKMPLLLSATPVLRWLWPNARFILALRDPRDSVMSNFQQAFVINAGMAAMLRLETAADHYDATMGVFHDLNARAPCRVHAIRYEDVVGDFDAAVTGLLGFLGLDWEDGVRDYAATARKRPIRTPSARAVRKPIYKTAVGKWRRYEAQMAPVRAVLDPWAERFGYDVA